MVSLRNFNLVLGGDLVAKALNALALLISLRTLSPHELGDYVYVSAIAITAYTFFNSFFNRAIVFNLIAETEFRATQYVALLLTVTGYGAVAAVARSVGFGIIVAGLALAGAAIVFEVRRSALQRAAAFRRFTLVEVGRSLLFFTLTMAVLIFADGNRAFWLLASLALSYFVAVLALRSAIPIGPLTVAALKSVAGELKSRNSLLLLGFFLFAGLAAQLPALLYRPIATPHNYAEFGVAFRYYGLLVSVVSAFNVVLMPAVANTRDADVRALIKRFIFLSAFAISIIAFAAGAGFYLMPLINAGKYPAAPGIFLVLASAPAFGIPCMIFLLFYQRNGRYMTLLVSQLVCVLTTALVLRSFAPHHPLAAGAAVPVGIAMQFLALVAGYPRWGRVPPADVVDPAPAPGSVVNR